ncbi:DUF3180 domain-containing protein [Allokutzneria sp. A3M-2-11 16]|uniref:DUF3180 domain-containing protein n=1 Tax=Allokutzneria sp. A3M-2-11 16 TaxID=2962043 RepID=UPI0020B89232|nr:DUF3180 domain-containing protein [Allokutzneria sp. A3M-2-11 16]MCP3799924.1 DUF3180 domain-containing protein [Allokutzneria sp. A3M-2-11 16]
MRFTRPRDLAVAALLAALVTHLLLIAGYNSLPRLPALIGLTFLVLGGVEAWFGFTLRARIQRKPGTVPVEALVAARAVALAKASSLAGAIMGGVWGAVLLYVAPRFGDLEAAAGDTLAATVGLVSSGALIGGALWLEHCCRTPDEPDDSDKINRFRD